MTADEWAERLRTLEAGQARFKARRELARQVFAACDGLRPATLRTLALGLSLSRSPLVPFARAFDEYADAVERGHSGCALGEIFMAAQLGMAVRSEPDRLDALIGRPDAQPSQPWPQLASALSRARELAQTPDDAP
jgi:hypothetical protein